MIKPQGRPKNDSGSQMQPWHRTTVDRLADVELATVTTGCHLGHQFARGEAGSYSHSRKVSRELQLGPTLDPVSKARV